MRYEQQQWQQRDIWQNPAIPCTARLLHRLAYLKHPKRPSHSTQTCKTPRKTKLSTAGPSLTGSEVRANQKCPMRPPRLITALPKLHLFQRHCIFLTNCNLRPNKGSLWLLQFPGLKGTPFFVDEKRMCFGEYWVAEYVEKRQRDMKGVYQIGAKEFIAMGYSRRLNQLGTSHFIHHYTQEANLKSNVDVQSYLVADDAIEMSAASLSPSLSLSGCPVRIFARKHVRQAIHKRHRVQGRSNSRILRHEAHR